MIKRIDSLDTSYNGDLEIDSTIIDKIKKSWDEFIIDKDPNDFFDGDIYCVTDIDDSVPSINISKTKFSALFYAKKTNEIIVRSLFSAGYIKTIDNYICIIINNRGGKLNLIGGMADSREINDNKFDYKRCLIREFMEELGFNLTNDSNFEVTLKYLKYPYKSELNKAHYPVGTIYEIKTNYTKEQLIDMFNKNEHDREVKELKFYNNDNYKDIFSCDSKFKADYLDELFSILFK